MKKFLLSVAVLIGATLVLSQDNTDGLNKVTKENIVNVQYNVQAES